MSEQLELKMQQEKPYRQSLVDRMAERGAASLTDTELLAVVLNDEEAAYNVMTTCKNDLNRLATMYPTELAIIPKMTRRKAMMITSVIELHRRKAAAKLRTMPRIGNSQDLFNEVKAMISDYSHEVFLVIFLNQANAIIHMEIVSSGGINHTVADPRLIIKHALNVNAVSVVLAHNHPSGSLKPSKMDEELTQNIKSALKFFIIKLLDHIIVSHDGYYSFADEGIL